MMSRFIKREYPEKLIDSETKKVIFNTSEKLIGKNKIKNGLPFASLPFVDIFSLYSIIRKISILFILHIDQKVKKGACALLLSKNQVLE